MGAVMSGNLPDDNRVEFLERVLEPDFLDGKFDVKCLYKGVSVPVHWL
jgi:hypothetical protein